MEIRIKRPTKIVKLIIITAIFGLGITAGYFCRSKKSPANPNQAAKEKNIYIALVLEVYDKIKENYWQKIDDEKLTNTFVLGIEKLTGQPQHLKTLDRANLQVKLNEINKLFDSEKKQKEFATKLVDVALANLEPFGRSRLYVKKDEIALKKNVENRTDVDHYQVLGVNKKASTEEINKAFEEKIKEVEKDDSPENEEKQKALAQAHRVLSELEAREIYNESGIEPTINYKLIRPDILYIHWTKFSPTTLDDIKRVTEKFDDRQGLDTLILDLRDNVGGAIDGLPYFLGPFIGNDQYAYQFFHQGEKEDFKTKIGWMPSLVRYKKVIVLINEGTQSSAEVMAAALKKYNVGILVGTKTKGWGTVEKVFKLDNQIDPNEEYSAFLVHRLTLRDDGQPIEGHGIDPVININDPDWEKQLYSYFHYDELAEVIKEIFGR